MAAVHIWAGLLMGWVLFFVFLTGTFGYLNYEVDRWMRPEQRVVGAPLPSAALLDIARSRLEEVAPAGAERWYILLPAGRGSADVTAGWQARRGAAGGGAASGQEVLDARTGLPVSAEVRQTGGGQALYVMHYALHYMPRDVALRLVAICTMFMLVAILSGIITHKKIFANFFTFRPGKGQRSWLDGHGLLAVSALPFHLMIAWSGLLFYVFTFMPAGVSALYPDEAARRQAIQEAHGTARADATSAPVSAAPLVALAPLLAQAEARWGAGSIATVQVQNPGRSDSRITFYPAETGLARGGESMWFAGATGEGLDDGRLTGAGEFNAVMLGLHEGRFAGPGLRLLYVLAGLIGTAMIATGLLHWSAKRKAKVEKGARAHFGLVAVDILNLGTIIGLPVAIGAYFWANRLLPVEMASRAAWEVHILFLVWGFTYLFAIWRPRERAWPELCWLAAAIYGLIPILNAVTTARHLGASVPAGDWVFAGFDICAFAAGLFFAFVARGATRRAKVPATEASGQVEATA